jgi:type-F conjugative transfer system pilin assembly protein TrbC
MRVLLAIFLLPIAAWAADSVSDEERIGQGRELVQKYSGKVDAVRAPQGAGAVNLDANSPSLQQFEYSKDAQKDFLDMATGKRTIAQVENKKKFDLMVFISFSLPEETIRQYSRQAAEYGAVLVLRGMHNNSLEQTKIAGAQVNPSGVEWNIAPATFRKFKIDRVPVIVLADAAGASVLEDGCAKESDYLRVDGDVSIHHALVLMKQYGKGGLVKTAENLLETEKN